jgi:prepilin-type N-terminal cleavage/methylation domain-containing protein
MNNIFILKRQRIAAYASSGFTVAELMVTVVILSILASIAIPSFLFVLQRERIQAVALDVAGWLEQVRNAAADQVASDASAGGCLVTFNTGSFSAGQTLAQVDQQCAVPNTVLSVPEGVQQNTVTASIAGSNPIVFTPRGLWIDAQGVPGQNIQLSLTLSGLGTPIRCIRLSPVLGAVEIGWPKGSATCNSWNSL